MKEKIQEKLDMLWGSQIISYHFAPFTNQLNMELQVNDFETYTKYTIKISEISSFYFLNDIAQFRKDIQHMDYLELTTIFLLEKPTKIKFGTFPSSFNKNQSTQVNLCLEVWSQALYLEASKIEIDGEVFEFMD